MSYLAHWIVVDLFGLLLLAAAIADIVSRKIPNWAVAGLVLTCIGGWIVGAPLAPWPSGLAAGLIALTISFGLYHFNFIGAGDAKLLAACALFVGLGGLPQMALLTALAGALIAVGYLIVRPRRVLRGLTAAGRAAGAGIGIPYGVAISIGAVVTAFTMEGFVPHVAF